MAYADSQTMSTRKLVSIGFVIALHVLLGYAFMNGLSLSVIKAKVEDLKTFNVEEPPPPPPPETPQVVPPPQVVSPPPIVRTPVVTPPQVAVVRVAPPPTLTTVAPVIATPAPPAPVAVAPTVSKAASARGNPASWVTTDDYPPSSIRNQEQGTSGLTFDINEQGRIENCRVTSSSGSSTLDDTACRLVTRRGRYSPALDQAGNPTRGGTKTLRFTWRLPEE